MKLSRNFFLGIKYDDIVEIYIAISIVLTIIFNIYFIFKKLL